jgi:hypothetical protein
MPNVNSIQSDTLAYLDAQFTQKIIEQSLSDISLAPRNATGAIEPYIAVTWGDLQNGNTEGFTGPRSRDYILPIYIQCIAPKPEIARSLHNKVLDKMLGWGTTWSGQVRKRPGGGMFAVTNSNQATEAYAFPASFGLVLQFE